jgi:hypothetical protein
MAHSKLLEFTDAEVTIDVNWVFDIWKESMGGCRLGCWGDNGHKIDISKESMGLCLLGCWGDNTHKFDISKESMGRCPWGCWGHNINLTFQKKIWICVC